MLTLEACSDSNNLASRIEHLLGNVILQLILGVPLELVHKMWRVGPLYIAGVILGKLILL